jgi:hypothetical protein
MTFEVLRLHGLNTGKLLTTRQPSAAELLSACSRFSQLIFCVSTLYSMDSQPPDGRNPPRCERSGGKNPEQFHEGDILSPGAVFRRGRGRDLRSDISLPGRKSKRKRASGHHPRYNAAHRARRSQIAPLVNASGVRCARVPFCKYAELVDGLLVGGIIHVGEAWDLGHPDGQSLRRSRTRRLQQEGGRPQGYDEDAKVAAVVSG